MGDEWMNDRWSQSAGYGLQNYSDKICKNIIRVTYIRWDTTAESRGTSSRRVHKGAHRGVISFKPTLDEETSEGGTVTSSRESHWMGRGVKFSAQPSPSQSPQQPEPIAT